MGGREGTDRGMEGGILRSRLGEDSGPDPDHRPQTTGQGQREGKRTHGRGRE